MEITLGKLLGAVAAVVLVPLFIWVGWPFLNELRMKREAPKLCVIPATRLPGEAYLRGRVAVVNEEHKWDWLIGNYLPEGLMATKPSEITTCVVLDWSWKVAGTYQMKKIAPDGRETPMGPVAAKAQTCKVTVVDLTLGAVVGEATFEGRVAEGIRSDGTGGDPTMGQKPVEEIEAWLHKLPRKT